MDLSDQQTLKNIIQRQESYIEDLLMQVKNAKDRLAFYKKEYHTKYGKSHEITGNIKPGDYIRLKRNTIIFGNAERVPIKHDGKWVRVIEINQVGNYDYWIDGRRRTAKRSDISEIRPVEKVSPDKCEHPYDAYQRIRGKDYGYRCTLCDSRIK